MLRLWSCRLRNVQEKCDVLLGPGRRELSLRSGPQRLSVAHNLVMHYGLYKEMQMSSWNLWYQNLRVVVFEEIGRLGDGSFAKDLKEILSLLPRLPRLQTRAENGSTHEDSHGAGEEKSGCPVQDMCRPAACGAPLPGHDHLRLCRPQVTRDCRASLRLLSVHGTAIGGHCWPLTRCPSFSSWIQCTPPCVHPATWRRLPTRCFLYSVYLASSSFCKLLGAR
ncbi:uncharacterized protein LOC144166702 isoform X2 [Haemaphysalis longicornis]